MDDKEIRFLKRYQFDYFQRLETQVIANDHLGVNVPPQLFMFCNSVLIAIRKCFV